MATGNLNTLPPGYRLLDRYEIGALLHVGIASVRYAATADDMPVVVEEYFPARLATRRDGVEVGPAANAGRDDYTAGLAGFLATARALARIRDRSIVPVLHWTGANGTGYAVTEDVDGETLALRLEHDTTLSDDELKQLMRPIIGGLGGVHGAGLLHRQINPEAIVLRADGTPMLRGFGVGTKAVGGARQVFDPRAATLADILPGYTALEQYSAGGREGPWTDIYALGAVMYRCVTGAAPADAPFRTVRTDETPATLFADVRDARMLAAIDAALAVPIAARPQSVPVWQAMLFGDAQRTLAANRAGRTSARGFGRAAAPSPMSAVLTQVPETPAPAETAGFGRSVLRWSVPALAATAIIALMTWVDTGVLRGSATDLTTGGAAAQTPGGEFSDPLQSGGEGPPMVVVPPGSTSLAGSPPAGEIVFDKPFALAKHEVTEADYARFAAAEDSRRPSPGDGHRRPVADVSWNDARAYADWLSAQTGREYRLPTEAEWQYAARAGAAGTPETDAPAALSRAAPVGIGPANAWGFHDMHGNVSEWVSDCGGRIPGAADSGAEATGDCKSRIRRGGWWNEPGTAKRMASDADRRAPDTGFRVAARVD